MSPSIDLIREGHNLWKRVWLTEFIRNLVFSLVISLFFYSARNILVGELI